MFNRSDLPLFFASLFFLIILIFLQDKESASVNSQIYFLTRFVFPLIIILYLIFHKPEISFYGKEKSFILWSIGIFSVFGFVSLFNRDVFSNILIWKYLGYIGPLISGFLMSRFIVSVKKLVLLAKYILFASIASIIFKMDSLSDFTPYFNVLNILWGANLKFESDIFAFVFALLFLLFYFENKNVYSVISLIFIILTAKRIVFISVLLIIILFFFFQRGFKVKKSIYYVIPMNVLLIFFTYLQASNDPMIASYIEKYFNLSLVEFNRGRSNIYEIVINKLGFPDILGHGVGIINSVLNKSTNHPELFHSDILRFCYEIGIVPFLFLLKKLYDVGYNSGKILFLSFMLNIFLISDNVIEYFPVMFIFYILFFSYSKFVANTFILISSNHIK
jgi:hypothetical protein